MVYQAKPILSAATKHLSAIFTEKAYWSLLFVGIAPLTLFSSVLVNAEGPCRRAVKLVQRIEQSEGRLGTAERDLYKEAIELCPEMPEIRYNFAQYLSAQNEHDEAQEEFRKAIEIENKVEFLLGLARSLLTENKNSEAKLQYEKVIEKDKLNPSALQGLAIISERTGDRERAISQFSKAIAVEPKSAEPHFNLGVLYEKKGMNDEALFMYQKAISLSNEKHLDALFRAGLLYLNQSKYLAAIKNLERAAHLDSEDSRYPRALGVAYQRAGKLQKAELAFRKALALDVSDRVTKVNLAKVLLQTNKPAKIIDLYEDTVVDIDKTPLSSDELYVKAIAQWKVGNPTAAEQLLMTAHNLNPSNLEVIEALISLFSELGKREQREHFETLSLKPSTE